jgi:GNAT superfamily N-acetyltransferase
MKIVRTTSENSDFQVLVRLLDTDLQIRDGKDHSFYAQFNKIDLIKNVVVCYINKTAVGCGAFKKFDESTVEIKRMFVQPDFRGKGIAGVVLKELEKWAVEENYAICVLETGKKQPEAIRVYQKSGYELIPNYGQYKNVENSVCMRKSIQKK